MRSSAQQARDDPDRYVQSAHQARGSFSEKEKSSSGAPGDCGVLCSILCFQAMLGLRNRAATLELKTTEFVKETSIETIVSQTPQELLCKSLEKLRRGPEERGSSCWGFKLVAEAAMAQAAT